MGKKTKKGAKGAAGAGADDNEDASEVVAAVAAESGESQQPQLQRDDDDDEPQQEIVVIEPADEPAADAAGGAAAAAESTPPAETAPVAAATAAAADLGDDGGSTRASTSSVTGEGLGGAGTTLTVPVYEWNEERKALLVAAAQGGLQSLLTPVTTLTKDVLANQGRMQQQITEAQARAKRIEEKMAIAERTFSKLPAYTQKLQGIAKQMKAIEESAAKTRALAVGVKKDVDAI